MNTNPNDSLKTEALEFLKAHKTGTLATLSPVGTPRARQLYYVCDENFSIYFLTLANTRKAADIGINSHVAFVVADENVPQTVQIEGTAGDISAIETPDAIVQAIFGQLKSNPIYEAPLTRFDAAHVKFFKLTPTWVRWGDFTSGDRSDEVMHEIAL